MYTTSLKTWARAVAVDSILIAALVAGVIYHIPYALEVSVFFMWWISVLGIIFGLLIALMPADLQATIETLETKLEFYKGNETKTKELTEKLEASKLALEKLWSIKMVNRLAASRTYLAYHWIADIVVWSLLVVAGHPILATFKVASFLISCILIGVARKKYRERLGIKTPDDIEEEFAKHRAYVRQMNDVVDDKTTK
ncbi:MAG: hypothetical protein JSS67_04820 [Bacteroidetes bacterium]|nr:hypothetical protein [Bacteroidota bacterium]